MNFNPQAFINPTSKVDYVQLLDEALRMVDELGEQWDQVFDEIKGEGKVTTEIMMTNKQFMALREKHQGLPVNISVLIRDVEQAVLQSHEVQAWKRDSERLDAMAQRRMLVSPEYEGGWHAEIYDESEAPIAVGFGECPRTAIDSAMEQQK